MNTFSAMGGLLTNKKPAAMLCLLIVMLLVTGAVSGCGDDEEKSTEEAIDEALSEVDEATDELTIQDYEAEAIALVYPYQPADESYAAEDDNQLVLVTVTVRNTGEGPLAAASSDFSLEADDGEVYAAALVTGLADEFDIRSPAPGSEETGSLLFEIPATATPVVLWEAIYAEDRMIELPASAG